MLTMANGEELGVSPEDIWTYPARFRQAEQRCSCLSSTSG